MIPVWVRAALWAGLAFLWLPVALLVAYAFSGDPVPFRWGGFSLRWFTALAANERLLEAAWLSLRVAGGAASLAVLLGGATGWVLARHGPFAGRALLGTLAGAPLVLPEVVTGLSLLLLFVALEGLTGWPAGRGALTVLLAHATLGSAYVAVIVQSRLASRDRDLEEAALDLGATPATSFATITLPLMAPSLAAGWLLAFTLSLDDVVLASFTSGPSGTTLPVALFSMLRLGMTPEVNALATLLLLAAGLTLGIMGLLLQRRD
ncbi:ABC transporter permease subunit [Roseomonas sp. SSH11]|uniref:ABC transporter permease subunit n=1 Tax=Pararoseomonas baculiformis TaxID=2820812 RepID=A0ABS4AJS9_9PROT|nr:ABC transporter permease subunit [Pararoseomonas baculiformis]MBP0446738.1 ABC transporter permease subunit [Pararoseomonas baculiformis]